ncbi:autotransporter-associated beta strand repeat-containing protein [Gracilinema caldarium]|uniref:Autotransporter-associated beta strand repeat protein n=1 Tax=Gracilinema caldarium (strain ATCC 51460 / DSM 7334 / H1) TaxID=744872 RepID=F8F4I7_GRAC1|nr:autotransporter-associated beta strand repeat-containing protein [Gracilinema caldarium]AEJ20634.1 autotransporter-associated beta strand repeat protein [Gracilinema caldarium DSM 7334]
MKRALSCFHSFNFNKWLLCILLFSTYIYIAPIFAQSPTPTKTWNAGTSGTWGTAANWSGGTLPSASDVVALDGTSSITLDNNYTMNSVVFNHNNANTVTFYLNGFTLLVSGGSLNFGQSGGGAIPSNVNIVGPGSINVTGYMDANENATNTINLSNNVSISISGTFWGNQNAGTSTTFNGDGTCSLSAASLSGTGYNIIFNNMTITTGGVTYHSPTTSQTPAAGTTITVTLTGTFSSGTQFQYTTTRTNDNITTNESYTVDGAIITGSVGATNFTTLSGAGTFSFNITYPGAVDAGDGLNVSILAPNGFILGSISFIQPSATIWNWDGDTSTDWSTAANWDVGSVPTVTSLVVIPSGTPNSPVLTTHATAASVTVDPGATLDLNGYNLTGLSTITNNGIIRLQGTETVGGTKINGAGSAIEYYGLSGTLVWGSTYENLTINSSGTVTANAAVTVAGNLTLTAGTLVLANFSQTIGGNVSGAGTLDASSITGGNTLTVGGYMGTNGSPVGTLLAPTSTSVSVGTNWNVTNFTHNGGTVIFTGTGTIYSANTFNNLSITTGAGPETVNVSGTLTVANNLSVAVGHTLAVGNNVLSVTGTTTNGGTITLGNQSATFGGLVTNAGGTLTGGSGTLNLNGGINGGTLTASSGTTNVGGDLTLGSFTHNSGVVVFTGSCLLTSNGQRFYDLTIGAGATVTPQDALVVNRNFVINNTGTYVHNGQSLTLGGVGGAAGNVTDSNVMKQNLGTVTVSTAAKTMTTSIECNQLTVTSTLNKGAGNDISVSGALNVTGGTLNMNGGGTVTVGGNVTLGTLSNGAGSTLALNGGGTQVVRPNGQTLGSVSVSGGGTVVQWSGTATTQNITINTGTTFRLDSTVVPGAVTLNVSAGSTVTNNGSFELNSGGGVLTLQGTAASANYAGNDISWSGQDLTMGNLVYGPAANLPNLTDVSLNAAVTFTNGIVAVAGSSIAVGTTTLSLGAASTLNGTMTVGAGGTVAAGANGITNGGAITFNGGGSAINCGAFTSTGTINNTGTNTITASGNVAISGTFNTPGNSTLVMTGAGTTLNAGVQIGNLTTGGTATVTSLANLQLAGSLNLGTGTSLALGGFGAAITGSATGAGTAQLNGGSGLVTVGGNFTVPDYIATSGTTRIGGTTVTFTTLAHSGGMIELNGTVTPVTLTTGNQTFNNLSITTGAGPETVNVSGTLTVANNLSVAVGHTLAVGNNVLSVTGTTTNSGTITLGNQSATFGGLVTNAGGTLTGGSGTLNLNGGINGGTLTASSGTTNVGGDLTLGSFTHNSGVVVFTGSCLLTSNGQRFYDLTIGAGATVTPQDALVVNRNFVINNTGTYVHNGQSLTLGGVGGAAGNVTDSNVMKQNLGTVTVSTAAKTMTTSIECNQLTVTSTLNKGAGNDISVSGALNVTGGTLNMNGGGTVTVGGNVTLGTLSNGAGSTLALNGGGTQVVRPNGQTLGSVSVSGGGTVVQWSGTATTQNITINTGTTFRLDSTVVPGAVTLNVSAGSTVTNNGSFELNSGGGVLTLQGTAASANYAGNDISWSGQDLTMGNLVYGPAANLPNLTDVSLNAAVTFTNGIVAVAGSSIAVGTTTLSLGAASTLNGTMTVGAGGTVAAGANGITNGGAITFNGGGSAINCGAFTSTGTINNTGTNTITASGNVAISGTFNTPGNSTLVMTGAGTTLNAGVQIGNLTTGGTATVTSLANLQLAGSLNLGTGTSLALGGFGAAITGSATGAGTAQLNGGSGLVTVGGNFTVPDYIATSGTTRIGGTTVTFTTLAHSGGMIELNGTVTPVTLTTGNQTFNNLSITTGAGPETVNVSGTLTVANNLSVAVGHTLAVGNNVLSVTGVTTNGGTITLGNQSATFGGLVTNAGGTLTGGSGTLNLNGGINGGTLTASSGTTNVGGDLTLGSFTHNSGVVVFTGSCLLTSNGQRFYDLTIGAGATVTPQDALVVNRNFVINNTGTYVHNGQSLTLGGVGGAAGNVTDSNVMKQNLGTVTVSTAAKTMTTSIECNQLTVTSTLNKGAGNDISVSGALNVTGGTLNMNGGGTVTVGGNVTLGTLSNGAGSTLALNGGGTQVVRPNGQTLGSVSVSGGGTVVQWSGTATTQNITINTGTTFRLDSTVVPGAVTLNVSAGSTVTNNGSFELNSGGGVLTLQGTAASANYAGNDISWSGQDLTMGNLVYGPAANLPNLTDVSLNAAVTFTNGIVAVAGSSIAVGTTTLSLGAASTLNGTMTVGAGGTVAAGANGITNGGAITFNGGGSAINCGAFTSTGTINNTGTNTITASGNVAISGTFNTPGNSTLVMTGAGTTLNAGVQIGNLSLNSGGNISLVSVLSISGNLTIQNGSFTSNDHNITVGGNWTNNTGIANHFIPGTCVVEFTSNNPVISGSNEWYELKYYVAGGTIRFERNKTQYFLSNGKLNIHGTSGNNITITRDNQGDDGQDLNWVLPAAPDPALMWQINLAGTAIVDLQHVTIYYSDARSTPISYDSGLALLGTVTADNSPPGEQQLTCYGWISGLNVLYSYTEDENGNGKIDRIKVKTQSFLNMDFSNFEVSVDGYEVDRTKGTNGFSGTYGDSVFYIWLKEKPYVDGNITPSWRIITLQANRSLKGTIAPYFSLGTDLANPIIPADTVPPRIVYTFSLPGSSETFFAFNEPINNSLGNSIANTDINDFASATALNVVGQIGTGSLFGVMATYPTAYNINDIANGSTTVTIANNISDRAQPITDWTTDPVYSAFVTEAPEYPNGTLPNPISLSSNSHRISDVLISVPPASATDDRYFVWPIWARDSVTTEVSESQYESAFPTGSEAAGQTIGLVRDFTGTQWLRDQDITLQVRVNPALNPVNLSLHFDSNVADTFRATSVNGPIGLWLPVFNQGSPSGAAFSGIVPWPNDPAHGGGTSRYGGALQGTGPLWNFSIPASDPRVKSVSTLDFFFTLDNGLNADNPLYVARLDVAPGAAIPSNWYRLVRPFSFDIHDVTKQRSNATILNNVIDPTKGERVRLSYQLTKAGQVTIQVFTLDGDLVQVLYRGYRQAGDYTASWDGKNRGGRVVARGMYFIRIVGPDIDEIRKVMVVKE